MASITTLRNQIDAIKKEVDAVTNPDEQKVYIVMYNQNKGETLENGLVKAEVVYGCRPEPGIDNVIVVTVARDPKL